jgi:hypothetical protein
MLYVKNVPTVERVIRFLMGLTLLGGPGLGGPDDRRVGRWRHGHDGFLDWPRRLVPDVRHGRPEAGIQTLESSLGVPKQ